MQLKKRMQDLLKLQKNIKMMVVDLITGKKANFGSKKTIIEVFKKNRLENINFEGKDDLQYKVKKNNILKFY